MTDDNDSARRAADGLLRQTLPAHGAHAGPSAHSAPLDTAGPGSFVITSRAVPTPEKSSAVFEAKIGLNTRRRGTVQAAEGLAQRDGGVSQAFTEQFAYHRAASAQTYIRTAASGRSGLADGRDSGQPHWADNPADLFSFGQGTVGSEIPGGGERGHQVYQSAIAYNPRNRRNNATVEE